MHIFTYLYSIKVLAIVDNNEEPIDSPSYRMETCFLLGNTIFLWNHRYEQLVAVSYSHSFYLIAKGSLVLSLILKKSIVSFNYLFFKLLICTLIKYVFCLVLPLSLSTSFGNFLRLQSR